MTASCPTCQRRWTSLVEAHCTVCHRQFTGIAPFDRHRPTRGGCPDPATLMNTGRRPALRPMTRGGQPIWTLWSSDEDRAAMRERLAAARKANAQERSAPSSDEQPPSVPVEG